MIDCCSISLASACLEKRRLKAGGGRNKQKTTAPNKEPLPQIADKKCKRLKAGRRKVCKTPALDCLQKCRLKAGGGRNKQKTTAPNKEPPPQIAYKNADWRLLRELPVCNGKSFSVVSVASLKLLRKTPST